MKTFRRNKGQQKPIFEVLKTKEWAKALSLCETYDDQQILDRDLKTKSESDLSQNAPYPSIFWLREVVVQFPDVHIVDFGGGLGMFRINGALTKATWTIVERANLVSAINAKKPAYLKDVNFTDSVDKLTLDNKKPKLLLISGTLPYIDEPYLLLKDIVSKVKPDFIIVDRTLCAVNDRYADVLLKQNNDAVYGFSNSYPARIMSLSKIEEALGKGFKTRNFFYSSLDRIREVGKIKIEFRGLFFAREKFDLTEL